MTNEERTLLLTIARVLRAHMGDHINEGPCFKYVHEDFAELLNALKPFDPIIRSNGNEDNSKL
jgi:hypothetical protein